MDYPEFLVWTASAVLVMYLVLDSIRAALSRRRSHGRKARSRWHDVHF
ncbi:hypothetical protein [Alsobacter soli]|nr:hypothetical protein [Alsobacter soli]